MEPPDRNRDYIELYVKIFKYDLFFRSELALVHKTNDSLNSIMGFATISILYNLFFAKHFNTLSPNQTYSLLNFV